MIKDLKSKKWSKLKKLVGRFKHIPFVDFVLVAGSMAMGSAHKDSDFDLIIGSKKGRIFTVRMISALAFEIDGTRRKASDDKSQAKDKICLNHFVTQESYKLDPPYNKYWKDLYNNLVPIYGRKDKINKFLNKNNWAGDIDINYDSWIGNEKSFLRKFLELMFHGFVGNLQEKILKKYQVTRIERNLEKNLGYKPQVKYNENELRFHIDTKRIEKYLNE